MTHTMTKGMSPRILPMKPETTNRGMKAAMVVSEEDITGASMRRAPPSAASSGFSPVW